MALSKRRATGRREGSIEGRLRWPCYREGTDRLLIQEGQLVLLFRRARWSYTKGPNGLVIQEGH